MGEILSVDELRREIILAPQYGANDPGSSQSGKSVRVLFSGKQAMYGDGIERVFPRCVQVGGIIRLWGQNMVAEKGLFTATEIRGCWGGGCGDPTGVRLRLLEGHRMMHRSQDQKTSLSSPSQVSKNAPEMQHMVEPREGSGPKGCEAGDGR